MRLVGVTHRRVGNLSANSPPLSLAIVNCLYTLEEGIGA